MKRKLNQLFLAAALMCGAMSVTSCQGLIDAVFGEHTGSSSGSTTKPVTPDDPAVVVKATDLLKEAQKEGATVIFWFMYQGDLYRAVFKKVGDDYVLQDDVASTRATTRCLGIHNSSLTCGYIDLKGGDDNGNTKLTVREGNGRTVLEATINPNTGSFDQTAGSKNTYLAGAAVYASGTSPQNSVLTSVENILEGKGTTEDYARVTDPGVINTIMLPAALAGATLNLEILNEIIPPGATVELMEATIDATVNGYLEELINSYVVSLDLKIALLPSYGEKTVEHEGDVLGETNDGKSLIIGWQKTAQIALIHSSTVDILTVKEVDRNGATFEAAIPNPVDGEQVHIVYAGTNPIYLNDLKSNLERKKADITKADIDAWLKYIMNSNSFLGQDGNLGSISNIYDFRYAETEIVINKDGTAGFKSVPTLGPLCAIWKIIPTGDLTTFKTISNLPIEGADIIVEPRNLDPYIYVVILPGEYTTLKFDAYNAENKDIHYYCTVNNASFKAGDFMTSTLTFSLPATEKQTGSIKFDNDEVSQTWSATSANTYTQEVKKTGDGTVTYSISDNTCGATIVESSGKVTFTKAGSVTVTAKVEDTDAYTYDPTKVSYTLTVNKADGSISYAANKQTVEKLTTDGAFTNTLTKVGDGKVTYSSDKESVATVDANGKVTIKGAGEATITATVVDSDTYHYDPTTASYKLKVVKPNSTGGLEDYNKNNSTDW